MRNLIIDTATDYLYISIIENNEIITDYFVKGNNNHSENLVDALREVLGQFNLLVEDLDGIYVGRGPGSYTGLRVSGTVCKVLAYAKDLPLYSFSSLDLVASAYLKEDGYYLSKIKAKKDHYYIKVLQLNGNELIEVVADTFLENASVEEIIKSYDKITVINEHIKFNPLVLFNAGLMSAIPDIHTYVPNYLRRSI